MLYLICQVSFISFFLHILTLIPFQLSHTNTLQGVWLWTGVQGEAGENMITSRLFQSPSLFFGAPGLSASAFTAKKWNNRVLVTQATVIRVKNWTKNGRIRGLSFSKRSILFKPSESRCPFKFSSSTGGIQVKKNDFFNNAMATECLSVLQSIQKMKIL